MARATFSSPGQMIGSGIGILILGIILLQFGIGFIGAIFGIWWIIKGIIWQSEISGSGSISSSRKRPTFPHTPRVAMQINRLRSQDNNFAAQELVNYAQANDHVLQPGEKEALYREASYRSILGDSMENANHYNQTASTYLNHGDYHNLQALIELRRGNYDAFTPHVKEAQKVINDGRYSELLASVVGEMMKRQEAKQVQ